jgi:hypothetical protein
MKKKGEGNEEKYKKKEIGEIGPVRKKLTDQ